jgi:hypothetical protein
MNITILSEGLYDVLFFPLQFIYNIYLGHFGCLNVKNMAGSNILFLFHQ